MFSGSTDYAQAAPKTLGVDAATTDTSEQGRPLPAFWGRKRLGVTFISNPFYILSSENSYGAAKGGGGGVGGYNYGVQYAAAVCAGPVDVLYGMYINGLPAYVPTTPITRGSESYIDIHINDTYGSYFRFYWGTETQTIDTAPTGTTIHNWPYYLADLAQTWWDTNPEEAVRKSHVAEYHSAYHGVCYFVSRFHQWESQTTCPKIEFVLGRWPNTGARIGPEASPDANLVDVITDCITNTRYGLGLSSSVLDSTTFAAVKALIGTEEMGISPFIDRAQSFSAFMLEMLNYVDGFYYSTADGKIAIGLNRGVECSAAAEDPVFIDEACLVELPQVEASGINTARSEVRVQFTNSDLDWKDDCCAGHSAGTLEMIGGSSAETLSRDWVTHIEVADRMARAAAKHRALPTVKGTFTVRKSRLQGLKLGDPFYFNYDHYGLCNLHCRVTEVSVSDPFSPQVEIGWEQDHGYLNAETYDATVSYVPTPGTSFTPPNIVDALLIELPATAYPPADNDPRFVALVSRPDEAAGAMVTSCLFSWKFGPNEGDWVDVSRNSAGMTFPPRCQLMEDIDEDDTQVHLTLLSKHDEMPDEITEPQASHTDWLLIFDGADEMLRITGITQLGDGTFLCDIARGGLDTKPQAITTGTPICYAVRLASLINMQMALRGTVTMGATVRVKIQSVIRTTASVLADALEVTAEYQARPSRPYKLLGATSAWPSYWDDTTNSMLITWAEAYRYGTIPTDWDGPVWTVDVRLPSDPFDITNPTVGQRYIGQETPHAMSHTLHVATLASGSYLGSRQTFVVRLYTRDTRTGLCSLWWDEKTIDYV